MAAEAVVEHQLSSTVGSHIKSIAIVRQSRRCYAISINHPVLTAHTTAERPLLPVRDGGL
jgi:hypothetical protein